MEKIKNINNISSTAIEADKNMEKLLKAQAEEDAKAKKETPRTIWSASFQIFPASF